MDKKMVVCEWADAWGEDEQIEISQLEHHPCTTLTIGYLIKEDEVGVTMATDIYPDDPDDIRNYGFIPRGMVRSITYLVEK